MIFLDEFKYNCKNLEDLILMKFFFFVIFRRQRKFKVVILSSPFHFKLVKRSMFFFNINGKILINSYITDSFFKLWRFNNFFFIKSLTTNHYNI